ncbi:unnamed protein product [Didymodactylos carnosus]|uniref:Uncharacterized protein n=1 Tax=Didymodactylos carnosus TaxID=1234261 RepID=A0A814CF22_9BILA|nr:unnamed protein product [Didymodactylos carnosus]CAF3717160.1 unnamed protein product [Didymodactylos carnosus]
MDKGLSNTTQMIATTTAKSDIIVENNPIVKYPGVGDSTVIVNIPPNETDRFLDHASSNVISDIPRSRNLEEIDDGELPFPGFVEKSFYCLHQKTSPRYQCLKLITWPYPFIRFSKKPLGMYIDV